MTKKKEREIKTSRSKLEDLATRITSSATWEDLALPEQQIKILKTIAADFRKGISIHKKQGFTAKSKKAFGLSALFIGTSGTGKTLAAEVLGNELGVDLFRIDVSQIISKYVGETEKNLSLVFDAAGVGDAILLFDEADALFGKRSEVKDSHERYANIEVSYLLQRIEDFAGLAILTTNKKKAPDGALLRRIRYIVDFPST